VGFLERIARDQPVSFHRLLGVEMGWRESSHRLKGAAEVDRYDEKEDVLGED
jgi:hypothetical protein